MLPEQTGLAEISAPVWCPGNDHDVDAGITLRKKEELKRLSGAVLKNGATYGGWSNF